METSQPGQTLASHLIAQTLSSVNLLESLQLITSADAQVIRSKLPPATTVFPQLAAPSTAASPTSNNGVINQMNKLGLSSPVSTHSPIAGFSPQQHAPTPAAAPASAPPAAVVPPESRARALWDYKGTEADDLAFLAGDMVIIDEEVNTQWYRGRVIPQGQAAPQPKVGLFPSNYVEKIPNTVARQGSISSPAQYGAPAHSYAYGQQQPYQQYDPNQQQQPGTVVVQGEDQKKDKFGKLGGKLGNAAVQGAGFGFGASIASNLVNAVL